MTGNTISENTADYGGGIFNSGPGSSTVTSSTITGNTAVINGGGIGNWDMLTLHNTIVTENFSKGNIDIYNLNGRIIQGHNNLTTFTEWTSGSANPVYNSSLPLFINAANSDYRLAPNSQAIDKGNNAYVNSATDITGNPRIANGIVDIGAYEYSVTTVIAVPTVPTGLKSTERARNTITLAWNASNETTGYEIQYRKSGTSAWTGLAVTQTSVTITGLDANTAYEFQVLASNNSGKSGWSGSLFVTTDAIPATGIPTHKVYAETSVYYVSAGDTISVGIKHELLNMNNEYGTGLGLKITYNPAILTYTGSTSYLALGAVGAPSESTTGVIVIGWNDMAGNWPGTASAIDLIKSIFVVKDGVSPGMSTSIHLAVNNPTPGFDVEAVSEIIVNISGPTHKVYTMTGAIDVKPGDTFVIDVKHELLNMGVDYGTGLGLRITYNPAWLTYIGPQSYLTTGAVGAPSESTSGIIVIGWNDMTGNWPGTDSSIDLLKALFVVKDAIPHDMSTAIQISVNNPTLGFKVEIPTPITVNITGTGTVITNGSLDVDGNGSFTTADVNLLLRYLFEYYGNDLTYRLTTKPASEIIEYLETNMAVFDIDGNGSVTTADANLLLRYLFEYHGNDLTYRLIANNAERKTPAEIIAYIESVLPGIVAPAPIMASAVSFSDIISPFGADMPTQQITASTNVTTAKADESITLKVFHEIPIVDPDYPNDLATGISLRVFYDPNYVEYQTNTTTYYSNGVAGLPSHDPNDHAVSIGWNDMTFSWPGTAGLVELLSLNFIVKENAPDGKAVFRIEASNGTPGFDILVPDDVAVTITGNVPSTVVTTLDDTIDPTDGKTSFREAITAAQNNDIIAFDFDTPVEITLSLGELLIDKNIKIIGTNVTLVAGDKSRVLSVASGTSVELVGLTLTGGASEGPGGSINNSGNLTLTNCTIENNVSYSYGGGIYSRRGILTINNCTITNNATNFTDLAPGVVSGGTGGGIYNIGTMYIND